MRGVTSSQRVPGTVQRSTNKVTHMRMHQSGERLHATQRQETGPGPTHPAAPAAARTVARRRPSARRSPARWRCGCPCQSAEGSGRARAAVGCWLGGRPCASREHEQQEAPSGSAQRVPPGRHLAALNSSVPTHPPSPVPAQPCRACRDPRPPRLRTPAAGSCTAP